MHNSDNFIRKAKQDNSADKESWESTLLVYLHDLVVMISVVVLLFALLFRLVIVSGTSMNNTLKNGDGLLIVSSVFYRHPKAGDIVVAKKASFSDSPIIKRVIATEGQVVDIDFVEGIVYVDGVALDEPYTLTKTTHPEGMLFPLTVDEGCIFVLGDNRDGSKDSRSPEIGLIDTREILGKAVFLFLPGKGDGTEPRDFNRIGVLAS